MIQKINELESRLNVLDGGGSSGQSLSFDAYPIESATNISTIDFSSIDPSSLVFSGDSNRFLDLVNPITDLIGFNFQNVGLLKQNWSGGFCAITQNQSSGTILSLHSTPNQNYPNGQDGWYTSTLVSLGVDLIKNPQDCIDIAKKVYNTDSLCQNTNSDNDYYRPLESFVSGVCDSGWIPVVN